MKLKPIDSPELVRLVAEYGSLADCVTAREGLKGDRGDCPSAAERVR